MEEEWVNVARAAFSNGFPKTASVGSCALVTIVIGNKVYVANCGDCKAVMISDADGTLATKNISKTFNANKKYEQERLRSQFPERDSTEIVHCRRNDPKACYVMGGLQPTRAIGDLRLKHDEFNTHAF